MGIGATGERNQKGAEPLHGRRWLGRLEEYVGEPPQGDRIVRLQPETLTNLRQGFIDRFRFVGVGGKQRTSDKIPDVRVLGVSFGCATGHLNRLVWISETAQQTRLFEQTRRVIRERNQLVVQRILRRGHGLGFAQRNALPGLRGLVSLPERRIGFHQQFVWRLQIRGATCSITWFHSWRRAATRPSPKTACREERLPGTAAALS